MVNRWLTLPLRNLLRFICQMRVMDPSHIGLFDLAEKRLSWIAQRQNVLARNIANADTPGYQAMDVQPFASVLSGLGMIEPSRTQPGHLSGSSDAEGRLIRDQAAARSLDRNGVTIDQQLTKVADAESTQGLVTTIWKAYAGMFKTALGGGS